ncbi:hypothetical protein HNP46_006768 [Pseudomonas nitritireducens]|uniref:Uncharacterized protein n=1 Tax=Pseudomonas nitroreducens TaxID=46680 RepID=A0A7W7KSL5_PSENT|nr:hypothetical protein [Pseudomonas nitritireducens]MBB4867849.1 hypothetical protein [Pseudomonas nitritireducens]
MSAKMAKLKQSTYALTRWLYQDAAPWIVLAFFGTLTSMVAGKWMITSPMLGAPPELVALAARADWCFFNNNVLVSLPITLMGLFALTLIFGLWFGLVGPFIFATALWLHMGNQSRKRSKQHSDKNKDPEV